MSEFNRVPLRSLLLHAPNYGASIPAQDWNGRDPRYLRITDIDDAGRIIDEGKCSISEALAQPYLLKANDIAIARTGNTVGKSYLHLERNGRVAFAGYLVRIAVDPEKADARFVFQYLQSPYFKHWVNSTLRIGAQPNINATEYQRLPFPDVSPPEQRKIAAILTTVDNLIEQTELLIEKYRRVKAGMMSDLLTRGIDHNGQLRPPQQEAPHHYKQSKLGWIPKEWEQLKLGDLISGISSGWSPICDSEPVSAGEWGILKTTAVVWDGYVETENKRLPFEYQPKPDIEVKADDILITRKGPVERVGVIVYVPQTQPNLMIPDTVFRIRLTHNCPLHPSFAPLSLGSETVQRDWFGRKVGLADAQVNINHSILRNTNLPVPPSDEQREILRRKIAMATNVHREQSQLEKLHRIKSGLMQNLLTGKVRVKVDACSGGTATT